MSSKLKNLYFSAQQSTDQHRSASSNAKTAGHSKTPSNNLGHPKPNPERPKRAKPEPIETKKPTLKKETELKSPKAVLRLVTKTAVKDKEKEKSDGAKTASIDSLLPPTLKSSVLEKRNLKLTKNFNNNNVWTNVEDETGNVTELPQLLRYVTIAISK